MNEILDNSTFFNIGFPIIGILVTILWFYCIWFLNKYDKNTNRLLMLLILNIYYVPFYLFRIKRIRKENRIKALSEEIYDSDFIEVSRNSITENLELWASKEKQHEYQKSESDLNQLQELFLQWENYYRIDERIIEEAFDESEIELLKTFDNAIFTCNKKLDNNFPELNDFQKTNDWRVLNQLAFEIIKVIKSNNAVKVQHKSTMDKK